MLTSKKIFIPLAVVLVLYFITVPLMEYFVQRYVNKSLDNLEGFQGSIGHVDIDLWRGAYEINDIVLEKEKNKDFEPFIRIESFDISVQWMALLHGRIVSDIEIHKPHILFAPSQSGESVDWVSQVKSLVPIQISRFEVFDAQVSYKDLSAQPPIDLFAHHLNIKLLDIRNVESKDQLLPSEIYVDGTTVGDGRITLEGRFNALKQVPDFDVALTYEGADLTYFNDYLKEYASLDFKEGGINVFGEFAAVDSKVSGYIKPVVTNIDLVSLDQEQGFLNLVWESMAAVLLEIFENQKEDQFALRIPLEGQLMNPDQEIFTSAISVLKNAFVQAFDKDVDGSVNVKDVIQNYKDDS